jgi:hypothetical protein
MNMPIPSSFSAGAAGFVNIGEYGEPITSRTDAIERMVRVYDQSMGAPGGLPSVSHHRRDAACIDAAEVFYTNSLERVLETITREPSSTELLVPGPGQLLPVQSTLTPGEEAMTYAIETPTGQAAWVEPDGVRRLPQVGEFTEQKRHTTAWSGIGYGVGTIESWRAAAQGRSLEASRAANGASTLRRFNERALLYGDVPNKIPGLLAQSLCFLHGLGTGFGALTDPDDAYVRLQIMDHMFKRMASSYRGTISQMIAPTTDLYALQRLRYDDGGLFLAEAMQTIEWLRRVRWVDGLEAAGSTGGAVWQGWSDDSNELWTELSPAPMLFGPFTDGLRTSWALLTHVGGVICRRRERMARFEFAA